MYTLDGNNLNPLFRNLGDLQEPYNQCRQNLPDAYLHNGYIDILNTNLIERNNFWRKNLWICYG